MYYFYFISPVLACNYFSAYTQALEVTELSYHHHRHHHHLECSRNVISNKMERKEL
jgi:hypothetical protein